MISIGGRALTVNDSACEFTSFDIRFYHNLIFIVERMLQSILIFFIGIHNINSDT